MNDSKNKSVVIESLNENNNLIIDTKNNKDKKVDKERNDGKEKESEKIKKKGIYKGGEVIEIWEEGERCVKYKYGNLPPSSFQKIYITPSSPSLYNQNSEQIGADTFLPILIYCIIQSQTPFILSNLRFIENYKVKDFPPKLEYYFISFCAAVKYIEDLDEKSIQSKITETNLNFLQNLTLKEDFIQNKTSFSNTIKESPLQKKKLKRTDYFYENCKASELNKEDIEELLERWRVLHSNKNK
eukprot:TRINITY_DN8589_c0_g1_i1.p1 TRINITY_DN8589_c0_g1~~TRINITY_DN8589_c0_g1_i1.p1  ORF type:complete len:268 (+),score=84.71 TRINITY_DN8589_c0_g1_i1:79-804(+)